MSQDPAIQNLHVLQRRGYPGIDTAERYKVTEHLIVAVKMMSGSRGSGSVAELVATALKFFAAAQCLLTEPWPKSATVTNGSHFDFIIVGAGTAGSTLAARLAQVKDFKVLLVEAGGYPPVEAIVPGFKHALKVSPYDWNFTTVNDGDASQGLAYGRQIQPRGKMLGGSGSMNDMVYSRGHPEDYYEWADIVGDNWNWTNVLEYFKKTERMTNENIINNDHLSKFHGFHGEIEVSNSAAENQDTNILLDAFQELGFDIVDDMTYPNKIGAGRFFYTISNGRRASSLTALLNSVRTDNLFVLNDTFVTEILIKNQSAVGVKALMNGDEIYFYANKEVIVSAGTFNSPKLLMLSGIGPKRHLEDLKIDVIQDLPVGNNLHDHVMFMNYVAINNGTCPINASFGYFEMIKYLYNASGTFSYSDTMGAYLPKSGGDANIPYFAAYPTCTSQSSVSLQHCVSILGYKEAVCQKIIAVNQKHELISLPVVLLKPQSRGKIRLSSANPFSNPLIYAGTFTNPADFDGYIEAIKKILELVNTRYFKENEARVLDLAVENCRNKTGDNQLRCLLKDYAMPAWHAVGTTAMGTVVDDQLRVIGVNHLRVVDAGVIPVIVRGNTNAVVVMIAEKAADYIKKTYGVFNESSRL